MNISKERKEVIKNDELNKCRKEKKSVSIEL